MTTRHLHDHDSSERLPPELWARLAGSFGAAARDYRRFRPDYPADAIAAGLRSADGRLPTEVLDLGAGTGKLTAVLAAIGIARITAVEPDPQMAAQIAAVAPGTPVLAGSAERIPLADAAVDAVTVGQAMHWFDLDAALPEMARVLRPGGRVVAVWNTADPEHAFTVEFERLQSRHVRARNSALPAGTTADDTAGRADDNDDDDDEPPFAGRPDFTDPVLTSTRWVREMTPEQLHGFLDTLSYVITADEVHRRALHEGLDVLIDGWLLDGGRGPIELAERCRVWVAVRR